MPPVKQSNTNYKYLPVLLEDGDEYPIDTDVEDIEAEIALLKSGKADKTIEEQIIGWTGLTDNTFQKLDLNPSIENGKTRFTILVYIRKGDVRVGVKFELTLSELNKLMSKAQKNMLCIVRMVCDPYNNADFAMLRQCVQAKLDDNNNIIPNVINIKYSLINKNGAVISGLDNYEWCMYAE